MKINQVWIVKDIEIKKKLRMIRSIIDFNFFEFVINGKGCFVIYL